MPYPRWLAKIRRGARRSRNRRHRLRHLPPSPLAEDRLHQSTGTSPQKRSNDVPTWSASSPTTNPCSACRRSPRRSPRRLADHRPALPIPRIHAPHRPTTKGGHRRRDTGAPRRLTCGQTLRITPGFPPLGGTLPALWARPAVADPFVRVWTASADDTDGVNA